MNDSWISVLGAGGFGCCCGAAIAHLLRVSGDLARLQAFWKGAREYRGNAGLTFGGDPDSPRSRAYDRGRNWMRKITRHEED